MYTIYILIIHNLSSYIIYIEVMLHIHVIGKIHTSISLINNTHTYFTYAHLPYSLYTIQLSRWPSGYNVRSRVRKIGDSNPGRINLSQRLKIGTSCFPC